MLLPVAFKIGADDATAAVVITIVVSTTSVALTLVDITMLFQMIRPSKFLLWPACSTHYGPKILKVTFY